MPISTEKGVLTLNGAKEIDLPSKSHTVLLFIGNRVLFGSYPSALPSTIKHYCTSP